MLCPVGVWFVSWREVVDRAKFSPATRIGCRAMNQLEMDFGAQPENAVTRKDPIEEALPAVHEIVAFLWRSIGKNVRRLREARGLTQEQLAEMTGHGKFGVSVAQSRVLRPARGYRTRR